MPSYITKPTLNPVLAILDWGIGGFGLYQLCKRHHPESQIIYFSDSGYTPYGKVEKQELKARLLDIRQQLKTDYGVTHLAIACHAASAALYWELKESSAGLENITVIMHHAVEELDASGSSRIGIIGGKGTIESEIYITALQSENRHITQSIAQPLSALIERGDLSNEQVVSTLQPILAELKQPIDHLLLGCTHYPAVSQAIQKLLPSVTLVDPAETMYRWICENWPCFEAGHNIPNQRDVFVTTGHIEKSLIAAKVAFENPHVDTMRCVQQ